MDRICDDMMYAGNRPPILLAGESTALEGTRPGLGSQFPRREHCGFQFSAA